MNANEEHMRLPLVADLLSMKEPLDNTVQNLAAFGWDYDGDGVVLTSQHLVSALKRYVEGAVSAADIEMWANQIEGRDDVVPLADVEDVLHELANPYLTQPLTHARAEQLLVTLEALT